MKYKPDDTWFHVERKRKLAIRITEEFQLSIRFSISFFTAFYFKNGNLEKGIFNTEYVRLVSRKFNG